jgi:hypothetical protein
MKSRLFQALLTLLIIFAVQISSFGETKRCLFIGDSYFSHNDLSKEFQAVWNDEISDTILITTHNRNGATIIRQWENNSDELLNLFVSQMWDYVIIELPRLATPQDLGLVQILHQVDSSLNNCRIICITMDFCFSFPEMACTRDAIEGVKCKEYLNCKEKLTYVRAISENIVNQKYKNSIQVIPFAHYKYFLYDQYSIELGSDDEYGHPSSFSQSTLARFILFHLMNKTNEVNNIQLKSVSSAAINISSFYSTFYNENHK